VLRGLRAPGRRRLSPWRRRAVVATADDGVSSPGRLRRGPGGRASRDCGTCLLAQAGTGDAAPSRASSPHRYDVGLANPRRPRPRNLILGPAPRRQWEGGFLRRIAVPRPARGQRPRPPPETEAERLRLLGRCRDARSSLRGVRHRPGHRQSRRSSSNRRMPPTPPCPGVLPPSRGTSADLDRWWGAGKASFSHSILPVLLVQGVAGPVRSGAGRACWWPILMSQARRDPGHAR
jgi:hypothetical protein